MIEKKKAMTNERRRKVADRNNVCECHRYCERVGRQHKSNGVYIVVDIGAGTYYQKCYDPDCRHFRGRTKALPLHVLAALAPPSPPPLNATASGDSPSDAAPSPSLSPPPPLPPTPTAAIGAPLAQPEMEQEDGAFLAAIDAIESSYWYLSSSQDCCEAIE